MKMAGASRFTVLALVMLATRFKLLGDMVHLPNASMAVFFLGGVYLRRQATFALMVVLAVLIDWVSVSGAGASSYCITAAYAFLPLAYAVLWYAGRTYAPHLTGRVHSLAGAAGVALAASTVSFAISNGAFYWLGGRYAEPNVAQYVARLWQWGPLFIRTTMAYVALALVAHAVCERRAAHSSMPRHQEGRA